MSLAGIDTRSGMLDAHPGQDVRRFCVAAGEYTIEFFPFPILWNPKSLHSIQAKSDVNLHEDFSRFSSIEAPLVLILTQESVLKFMNRRRRVILSDRRERRISLFKPVFHQNLRFFAAPPRVRDLRLGATQNDKLKP